MNSNLAFKISHLSESPGCYLMKSGGEVIYVGKAKNLKNRVRQYFQSPRGHTPKVRAMVEKVDDFETVLVDGELEALILECNLIKRYRPFYNILLKDDKHYPYIAIDFEEEYPRIQLKRRQEKDQLKYFGPYPGASVVREVMDVVRLVFPIRACDKAIRPDPKNRPCVHHAVGQCLAPCAGKVDRETYMALVRSVSDFLSGRFDPVLDELESRMREAAAEMNYERAALWRDRIRAVKQVMQKQKAIYPGGGDADICAVAPEGADAIALVMTIREGKLLGSEHFVLPHAGDEELSEVLTSFLLQFYEDPRLLPGTVFLDRQPAEPETLARLFSESRGRKVALHVPERGEKKRLVEMAEKNLSELIEKRAEKLRRSYERTTGALIELQNTLNLSAPPRRIEGYDISNTQGSESVGSMVVMIDGLSANKEYRHFRIKTVEGPNDFASMREVLSRRFRHGLEEKAEREAQGLDPGGGKFSDFPDLILIDGGKGQLGEAQAAMREAGLAIPMFGLAKRLEEIVLPGREDTILLDRHSEALHLIQRLRDEAHRFGITHHRKLRAKASVASSLDGIPGVGPKKKKALLKAFKTVEAIRAADEKTIAEAEGIGPQLARAVWEHYHKEAPAER